MAHFALLDESNTVTDVIVVNNDDIGNLPFPDSEEAGRLFLANVFPGLPSERIAQTSYNGNFRVRYAGIGFTFVPDATATPYGGFSPPKQADDFIFDEPTCQWIPPIPYPTDGKTYEWDFTNHQWVLHVIQPPAPVTIIGG